MKKAKKANNETNEADHIIFSNFFPPHQVFQTNPKPSAATVSPTCCPRTAPTRFTFESKTS
jgi:hypothetical protein